MTEFTPIPPEAAADASASREIAFTPAELRPRRDGWTAEKQITFIEALTETACVDEACRRVGMSDTSAYKLRSSYRGRESAGPGTRRSIAPSTGSSRARSRARSTG